MQRRSFLRKAALLPLPLLLNQFKLSALAQPFLAGEMNDDHRVLVLIQLDGGNDGLNTLIPLDQYDNLAAVRGNLLVPENSLLPLSGDRALHPALGGVRELYDAGKVGIVQGVGYAQQNRSHFRSTDIWQTGSSADEVIPTGWLGRHLDARYPNFPDAYPNVEEPAPFAIVIGTSVSETCQGRQANFSIALNDIDNISQIPGGIPGDPPDTPYGRELSWLREVIDQSNQYATTISEAVDLGNSMVDYPEDNELAAKLRSVARLISGGLQSKVYIVQLGGFDTHANQVVEGETTTGIHANLLQTLGDAVAAFQQDLAALNLEDRVVGMTYSEFGRRIRSNASTGSDHGDAAPLFLFGSCVNAGVTGQNPEIDPNATVSEGVAMQYDFRNVYGSLLVDWLGVGSEAVRDLLLDDFAYIPLVTNCNATTSTAAPTVRAVDLSVMPNPSNGEFQVIFTTATERTRLSVFNTLGQEVRTIFDRTLPAGEHRVPVNLNGFPPGAYHVHLMLGGGLRRTKRVIVY